SYNRLLKYYKAHNQYPAIEDGTKIKYVYLKDNPLSISEMAFKTYDDPPQIMQYIEQYVDRDKMFDAELRNKLEDLYDAMRWGRLSTDINQSATEFFSF